MRGIDSIEVLLYETASAAVPIEKWLIGLDHKSRARILARIAKIRSGNLGDWSSLSNTQGVCEFREFFGPGYRIYFARESQKIVLLLCGSDKSDQKRTIKLAAQYWQDYQKRSANDEVREVNLMAKSKSITDTLNSYLQDPAEASAYLDAVLESGDNAALLVALRDVVDARGGVSELAAEKGLSRETLYRTLAEGGNPTLDTLSKVLEFAGLRVSILPLQDDQAKAG